MRRLQAVVLALATATLLGLGGCATAPAAGGAGAAETPVHKIDPWENWNRKVFVFNDKVDSAVIRPVAEAYRDYVPQLVRTGVSNVFGNIKDVWSAANQLLQGKLQLGVEMGMRVLTNTFFGLGGLLDPATEMRLTRHSEDFGQTLGRWGFGPGPFLVLPLLGPSSLRDTIALPADRWIAPGHLPSDTEVGYAVTGLELVNARAELLSTTQLLDQIALDRYSFVRDAYLARRLDQVYDGAPPMDTFQDEPAGDAPPAEPSSAASAPKATSAASAPTR
jgi:phospholipid-binding lipoprotein MlaA